MRPYYESDGVTLYHGEALDVLRTLPDGSVDAVVTDPPYPEIDRPYGRWTVGAWRTLLDGVIAETRRVLTPRGSAVFILQPNSAKMGTMRLWLWEFLVETARSWNLVQDVYWWNTAAMPLTPSHRTVGLVKPSLKYCLWFGPSDCYRDQDKILLTPSESMKNDARNATYGRTTHPSGASINHGRLADLVTARGGVVPFNVLPIANSNSSTSGGAYGHGAATPLPLLSWWTRYLGPPGGVILDPFAGSGTTGLAARQGGQQFIGIEKEAAYCAIAAQRLAAHDVVADAKAS